jgi:hypothetical protein
LPFCAMSAVIAEQDEREHIERMAELAEGANR